MTPLNRERVHGNHSDLLSLDARAIAMLQRSTARTASVAKTTAAAAAARCWGPARLVLSPRRAADQVRFSCQQQGELCAAGTPHRQGDCHRSQHPRLPLVWRCACAMRIVHCDHAGGVAICLFTGNPQDPADQTCRLVPHARARERDKR